MTPEERLAEEEAIVEKARARFAPIILPHTDPYDEFVTVGAAMIGGGPRVCPGTNTSNDLSGDFNKTS